MKIHPTINKLLKMLINKGYQAYIVGGAVRDAIIGKIANDYDVATDALPSQIKEVFKGYVASTIGEKHGTVGILMNNMYVEVTTFRIEGDYNDFRHPDQIEFTPDIKEDLKRRDFTMNAIAYYDHYVDYYNGIDDIKNKIIRAVGDPKKRFGEDALRIIRAVRFASTLSFEIEKNTQEAIKEMHPLLQHTSIQRINYEIAKALEGKNFVNVFENFHYCFQYGLIVNVDLNDTNNLKQCVETLKKAPCNYLYRLSIILYYYCKNVAVDSLYDQLLALSFSKKNARILAIVNQILNDPDITNNWKDYFIVYYQETVLIGYDIKKMITGNSSDDERIKKYLQCSTLKQLAINGNDLYALGFKKQQIKETLLLALSDVMEGNVNNNHDDLINYLYKLKEKLKI